MHALVLSGGGAKGAYQVGMLHALTARGEVFDAAFGTSVGALNAMAFSVLGVAGMQRMWASIQRRSDIFTFQPSFLLGLRKAPFSHAPLRRKVETVLASGPLCIPVTVAYTDLYSGRIVYHSLGADRAEDVKAVTSSAIYPIVVEPWNGRYADGGLRDIVPVVAALKAGATRLTVLLAEEPQSQPDRISSWFQYVGRCLDLALNEILISDLVSTVPCKVYAPQARTITSLDFNPGRIAAAVKHGIDAIQTRWQHGTETK